VATPRANVIFVTGTDTGVGKTVLTAGLLSFLRHRHRLALAIKPFCSGSRSDARLLRALQADEALPLRVVNPFFFRAPVAPGVAAAQEARDVPLSRVLDLIAQVADQCSTLIVEGAGGLLVPLGRDYTVLDLIAALDCRVILVSANRLGTINHTLLSVEALKARGCKNIKVVLMEQARPDPSVETNLAVLSKWLFPTQIRRFPRLRSAGLNRPRVLKSAVIKSPSAGGALRWLSH
jgi:dethiobiotin synthase